MAPLPQQALTNTLTTRHAKLLGERESIEAILYWLKGYTVPEMAVELGVGYHEILGILERGREYLREHYQSSADLLAAERITGFRLIQREARDFILSTPRQRAQLLSIILKAEENIAKIQGVLSDRVHHLVDIRPPKLYDFQDNFPPQVPPQSIPVLSTPVQPRVSVSIPEPPKPPNHFGLGVPTAPKPADTPEFIIEET